MSLVPSATRPAVLSFTVMSSSTSTPARLRDLHILADPLQTLMLADAHSLCYKCHTGYSLPVEYNDEYCDGS